MEPFEVDWKNLSEKNVAYYCINRLSEKITFPNLIKTMMANEGIGGDIDWGIHKWDQDTLSDYGIPKFEGWRCYMGPEENGTDEYINCYLSDIELRSLLSKTLELFINNFPEQEREAHSVLKNYLSEVSSRDV